MPFEKSRPVIPKSQKRKYQDIGDDDGGMQETLPPSVNELLLRKVPPAVGRIRDGSSRASGHNCPCKDAGTTHPYKPTVCFRHQHAGYCPGCSHIVCWKKGCPRWCTKDGDKIKGFDLLRDPLATWEKAQYHKDHNIVPSKSSWEVKAVSFSQLSKISNDTEWPQPKKKTRFG